MQTNKLATLLLILMVSVACDSRGKTHAVPTGPSRVPVAQTQQLTDDDVRALCNRVAEIKVLPMKGEKGIDATVDAFMDTGLRPVPCLIDKVTDETPMADPRQAPTYSETKVGDIAFFLIARISNLDYAAVLPAAVTAKLPDQGIYAYFEYVEKPKNRKTLQTNLRAWFQQNFPDAATQKRPAGSH